MTVGPVEIFVIAFNDPEFQDVYAESFAGVKRVLRTSQHLFMYNASGHGAWEASLTNLLSPGETILVLETGFFSEAQARIGRPLTPMSYAGVARRTTRRAVVGGAVVGGAVAAGAYYAAPTCVQVVDAYGRVTTRC